MLEESSDKFFHAKKVNVHNIFIGFKIRYHKNFINKLLDITGNWIFVHIYWKKEPVGWGKLKQPGKGWNQLEQAEISWKLLNLVLQSDGS